MVVPAELRVVPIGTRSTSLSTYVAEVLGVLKKLGVKYVLAPFGTCVEVAGFEDLAVILEKVCERLRDLGVKRVSIDVVLDVRFDKETSLEYKVRSVEEKVGKTGRPRD